MTPTTPLLTSRRNPLVQRLRSLQVGSGRQRCGELLAEGTHLLQECLRLGLAPDRVLATPAWIEAHPSLVSALPAQSLLQPASREVIQAVATTRHPDGVVLTLPIASLPGGDPRRSDFVLALDRLQDPGNLGTLIRTALAAGVDQIWLGEGADPLQPKVVRASSGAVLALPPQRMAGAELAARLRGAQAAGMQVVAAVAPVARGPRDRPGPIEAEPYWLLDWTLPTVLLLGNEGAGLDRDLVALADRRLTIPHSPAVESLNVAVAAAPLLLERWRRRYGAAP